MHRNSVSGSSLYCNAAISGFIAAFFVDGFDRKKILLVAFIGFLLGTMPVALLLLMGSC
jgi:MFS family permease